MGAKSAIQWTDATVNFWTGCKKVSEGCKFCYMYRDKERYGKDPSDVVKVRETTINGILKKLKPGSKIFTCSWSDFFIEEADTWRPWAWDIIRRHPQHTWQILTKRPERIAANLPEDWGAGWPNVWLGVSVENQGNVGRLEQLDRVPAVTKFISFEPLLGPIEFEDYQKDILTRMDWAIIGGESGNEIGKYKYRPVSLLDFYGLIRQLRAATEIYIFVKQLGTYQAKNLDLKDRHGGNWEEWPETLKIREFPKMAEIL